MADDDEPRVTITAIAREAGVSVPTVSRVLNGRSDVSPHTRERVEELLRRFPQMRERISLIQVVVPSRVDIPEYHTLKTTIERPVGEINGEFMRPGGWVPSRRHWRSCSSCS